MLGSEVVKQMKEIKNQLDPNNILGVGNIFV
jgi:FAD/FMN-containing dehydrogenase